MSGPEHECARCGELLIGDEWDLCARCDEPRLSMEADREAHRLALVDILERAGRSPESIRRALANTRKGHA